MDGWVKLHRELLEKPIWAKSTSQQKIILITLLMMANHKSKQWEWMGEKFEVKEGQFITSIDSIKKNAGKDISTQNVRSALAKFEKYEFLTNISTKTGRLISIVNWGVYQATETEGNKATNKEVTKNQQRGNKEVTPNKNDNNDKNDKKNNSSTGELFKFYDNNIQPLTEYITNKISTFLEDGVDDELMLRYFQIAVERKKCNWAYIQAIAQNNLSDGIKTVSQYEESERQFKEKQIIKINTNKVEQVNNFKQREYEKDEFEQFYSNK